MSEPPRSGGGDGRRIAVIGAALDLGAGRRGVDMGPSAIRYAQLDERVTALGIGLHDHGNVRTRSLEATDEEDPRARYWGAIKRTCEDLAAQVSLAVEHGELPLVLGGDHSVAIGTLGGLAKACGAPGAVLWLDAHSDVNTPATSPTGNVHGMPLAIALGFVDEARFRSDAWPIPMVREEHTVLVGIRSVDEGERRRLRGSDVKVHTMYDIDRDGMRQVIEDAIERLAGAPWVHVSLDVDVIDPEHAPGVGTPVRGGITYREAHLALEMLAKSGIVSSLEVVEVNPILDERNATGSLAVELVCSALGARIV
jgi:arginase